MTDVLLVDWLGRGGISQLTDTWSRTLRSTDIDVEVASRSSGLLDAELAIDKRIPTLVGGVEVHLRMIRAIRRRIQQTRPSVVVLQNYWIPVLEQAVVRASHEVGAAVIVVVHNHRPHEWRAGTRLGLRGLVEGADAVVAHSEFVATALRRELGARAHTIGHPVPLAVLDRPSKPVPELAALADGALVALSFGVLKRKYKGRGGFPQLRDEHKWWTTAAAGIGASGLSGVDAVCDRFLSEDELRWVVEHATVSVLPYRSATQSGAVVLAQLLGAPPIASAVGGLSEQIIDQRTGLLVPADAPPRVWTDMLRRVRKEPAWWDDVRRAAHDHVWAVHREAEGAFRELVNRFG